MKEATLQNNDNTGRTTMVAQDNGTISRRDVLRVGALAVGAGLTGSFPWSLGRPSELKAGAASRQRSSSMTGKQLNVALYAEPANFDLTVEADRPSKMVSRTIYDTLFYSVPALAGSKILPGLAEGYEVNSDATVYTLTFRRGVTFHDGTPFDASSVKEYFDRAASPTRAPKASEFRAYLGPYKGSRLKSEYELVVEFSQPNAAFINNSTLEVFGIPSPTAVAKYGSSFGLHPVGTGPFIFESYTPNKSVVLRRNPRYKWGPPIGGLEGPARVETFTWRIITSVTTQQAALQSGEIQVAQDLLPTQMKQLAGSFTNYNPVGGGVPWGYMVNMTKPPTTELAVRQALLYATNLKQILAVAFDNLYPAANSVLTHTMLGHDPTIMYPFDPSKAEHLLESAGWKLGGGGTRAKGGRDLVVTILIPSGFGFDTSAELLAAQWQNVGVKTVIDSKPVPYAFTLFGTNAANLFANFDFGADPSMLSLLFGSSSPRGARDSGYSSHATDVLLQEGLAAQGARRAAIYREISHQIMAAGAFLPIHDLVWSFTADRSVRGLAFTFTCYPLFQGTYVS
jgi:peptide/nickel transport system substrate-binding protein